jgi:hypothetical protein
MLLLGLAGCPQLMQDDFGTLPASPLGEVPDVPAETLEPAESLDPGADAGLSSGEFEPLDGGVETPPLDGPDAGVAPPACVVSTERCDGRDNDCDDLIDEAPACPTGCRGLTLQASPAMFCGGAGVTFATAETRCSAQGMRVLRTDSAGRNDAAVEASAPLYAALATVTEPQDSIWIDANDGTTEGTWRWGQAGSVFWIGAAAGSAQNGAYANWDSGKPNNSGSGEGEDCAVVYVGSGAEGALGSWNDHPCDTAHAFVCETP